MVGQTYSRRLEKLGIKTAEDLLHHLPSRYLDLTLVSSISQVQPGETVTVRGKISSIKNQYTKKGKKIQVAEVGDDSGQIEAVWFNQPFLVKTLRVGAQVSLAGKVDFFGRRLSLVSPEYEIIKTGRKTRDDTIHTGRLVPVYPETYGVSSKWLRSRISPLVERLVPTISDWLPERIREKEKLIGRPEALTLVHFPQNLEQARRARRRLAFDELFLLALAAQERKRDWAKKHISHPLRVDQEKVVAFIGDLPFELTDAQKRVTKTILSDLGQKRPMNRLLQGDVGSGKTVVAAIAAKVVKDNGLQTALMAPTEILAGQHYRTLKALLEPTGAKVALLTGSQTRSKRQKKKSDNFDIIVGTHALIYDRADFDRLSLAVIDEQHRFGVEQRAKLIRKAGKNGLAPHVLTMTATPIPRTVALTVYGDLDLSIIDELPPGRMKVKTWVVPPAKRASAYEWIQKQINDEGIQAFIICPLIEESAHETLASTRAATTEYERLKEEVFPQFSLGLLHGRLKSDEKEKTLDRFRKGKHQILVATPVVEVGIDIPGATIMMIEGAERFGLAQLHQLRGRVGRGQKQSYCLLFSESSSEKTLKRLKVMERINVGLELAELDLKIRGPGEIYGARQHGFPQLAAADIGDLELIETSREAAIRLLAQDEKLAAYPGLRQKLKEAKMKPIEPN